MPISKEIIAQLDPELQSLYHQIEQATTCPQLVSAAWCFARALAVSLVEEALQRRARERRPRSKRLTTIWSTC
jgi:radical SAM superfamily enzyme